MSGQMFFLGLGIGLLAGAAWMYMVVLIRELRQEKKALEQDSWRRYLRELQTDIDDGRTP